MEKKKGLQFEKHEVKLNPSDLNVGDDTPPALGPGGDLPEEEGVGSRRQPVEEEGADCRAARAQPRGPDSSTSDASGGLRGNSLKKSPVQPSTVLFPQQNRTRQHVGASPARVRVRETVQRGRSHPMDAGELVRLRGGTLAPRFFFPPLNPAAQ